MFLIALLLFSVLVLLLTLSGGLIVPGIDNFVLEYVSAVLVIVIASILIKKTKRRKKLAAEELKAKKWISRNKVIAEQKTLSKVATTQKCPNCGGDITELDFYKLKAGNDVKCEYCGTIISGGLM